jgi:hypothetical protein
MTAKADSKGGEAGGGEIGQKMLVTDPGTGRNPVNEKQSQITTLARWAALKNFEAADGCVVRSICHVQLLTLRTPRSQAPP